MIMLYPVGIPCLYFVLTWNSRHALDPDPLFVVADVACDGKLTKHNVPIHKEMRHLANSITMIHGAKADVRKKAIEFHATKIAEQDAARARVTSDDSQGAIDQGVSRQRSSLIREGSSAIRDSVTSRATKLRTKLRDQNFVAENWEDYLPEEAAVVIQLEASVTTVEAELVHQYRNANPSVQLLAFLVGAYEPHFFFWESIECVRRLALTGLLVFFADGTQLQILVASLIALASLYLYSKYRPYLDDRVDSLATMAQLMIFFQVSQPTKEIRK